jgi:class 3 adenylate cyclase
MSQSRPQTILFADVAGSTRLFETKGDVEARRLTSMVLDALTIVCNQYGGRVIKTIGDEIMCTIPTALDGLLAARDMQRKMARDINFVRDSLAVRIGLHFGPALEENGDVYGDAVNTAARMTSLAKREQIVTTATTVAGVGNAAPETRGLGRARVSGKLLPIEIVDVVWQEDTSGMTMVQSAIRLGDVAGAAPVKNKLKLRHRGNLIELDENSEPFMMGRETSNDLVVEADWVSRTHAQIEFKRGHFMICDRSTNATYVTIGQDAELRVHRDELHLRKSGSISMGQAAAINTNDLIHFDAE